MVDTMSDVPLWVNILVYMTMYQWYLLAAILPTIYLVIVKLFGFPLLQRWSQEVIIVLYPTKAKFAKVVDQYQTFFAYKKGIYWMANPLQNVNEGHKFKKTKEQPKLCAICGENKLAHKSIIMKIDNNPNQIQIFTHAINQAVYDMERRDTKASELVHGEHKVKSIPRHGIWIMKNPLLHFHRHWEIIVDPTGRFWKLVPSNTRQQFSISLWHTLGVTLQKIEEVKQETEANEGASGSSTKQVVVTESVTNQLILQQIKYVSEYHNFSANAAFRLCKKMKMIESNFYYWVSGSFNILPILILGGAVAAIGLVMYMFHSGPALGPMPK